MHKITRQEAKQAGQQFYYTDKPCYKGHTAKRSTATAMCCQCKSERYVAHREQTLAAISKWQQQNKEQVNSATREWRVRNPNSARLTHDRYYATNKAKKLASNRLWRQLNKAVVQQYGAKRRAQIRQAMPVWANVDDIVAVYRESVRLTETTGISHHVDHIVPLVNDLVCGLHVSWNLRAIPAVDNIQKGNKLLDVL